MPQHKLFKTFISDRRGYVAIVFAILALPLIGIAGAAIDYRNIGREQAMIRTAAEAAAVAAARAHFKLSPGGGEEGEDYNALAESIFTSNYTVDENKVTNVSQSISETDDANRTITYTVTADAKTSLLQVIGFSSFPISVSAKAAAVFSDKNVEVHLALDMSPSMGAPDDGSPSPLMGEVNGGDGCYFMCHDDGTTIRDAGMRPKMDAILNSLADSGAGGKSVGDGHGFIKTLGDAAEQNPITISMGFYGHYFDHHFYGDAYFANHDRDTAIGDIGTLLNGGGKGGGGHYMLGADGVNGGTDLKTSFEEFHAYLTSYNPIPEGTRRIILIISDGMHARAKYPFDPAACTALKADGDVYTLYIKNPKDPVYNNPNLTYVIPSTGEPAIGTWNWNAIENGGNDAYGYYTGLNNAANLMRSCATKDTWAYEAETGRQITEALTSMAETIVAPQIRVID